MMGGGGVKGETLMVLYSQKNVDFIFLMRLELNVI